MSLKVGVLMGGWSPEKKVSLMSGKNVVEGLRQAGLKVVPFELTAADKNEKKFEKRLKKARFDAVFIALHGGFGEDGTLQALLDQWGIAYTGSGALACGLAMHKGCSKLVFEAQGIPSAPWHALHKTTEPKSWLKEIKLALPLVVKPADVGSAIGVTIVKKKPELAKAIRLAFKQSDWAIIEKFISGVEVTVTVLGETALPVIEIVPKNEFYDFDAKYTPGHSEHIVPARISPAQTKRVKALALKAGKAMGCSDYYRVDFIVPKKGEPQILEINTAPGMTLTSLVPDAAKAVGISFPALLKTLVGMALKSKKGKKA
jgi:D-alanine-D-alanine ligase